MAANTGVVNGSDMLLYVTVATVLTPIAHITNQSFDSSMATKDRSSKDTGSFVVKRKGKITSSISFEGLCCYNSYSYNELYALHIAGTEITVKYGGHKDSTRDGVQEQVGDKYFTCTGIISALKRQDNNDEDSTISGTIEFTAQPVVTTVAA
jgi:hypothetical protein